MIPGVTAVLLSPIVQMPGAQHAEPKGQLQVMLSAKLSPQGVPSPSPSGFRILQQKYNIKYCLLLKKYWFFRHQ